MASSRHGGYRCHYEVRLDNSRVLRGNVAENSKSCTCGFGAQTARRDFGE